MEDQGRTEGFRPGDVAGMRYRIVRQLGEGGMGKVYLAEDSRLTNRRWAVKWVPASEGGDPSQPEKEAGIMTSLQHPALPRIIDYFDAGEIGGCCLVMDYLEGETLLERSASFDHRLPWTTVADYAAQLCDLLDYLHSLDSPIVFRDMKPSNVIVGPDDSVKLIDFGIARTYKAGKTADTIHVGSVGFAAPELLANRQTDHRADLYSLGCLLYFLLSGGSYYNFTKKPIAEAVHGLPPELCETVDWLLIEDSELRCPDARSAKRSLLRLRGDAEAAEPRRGTGSGTTGRRTVVSVFGLFPNVGATFVASAMAELLAERRLAVTYIEFPWQPADDFLRMQAIARGAAAGWREGAIAWRLRGEDEREFETAELYKLLFETKGDVIVFDVGAGADPDAAEALLRASDAVVAVASPDPAGLRSPLAVANWRLVNGVERDRVGWVANRMPDALKLPEFYKLFGERPWASIPELTYDKVMQAKWNGRRAMEVPELRGKLRGAMQSLVDRAAPPAYAGKGLRAAAKRWLVNKWAIDYTKDKFE
ncbi:protein kinase [Paenibacillus sp. TRM 82003]|nr:protein kinase [Paenibacillus sp. TRM 82003]